MRRRLTSRTTPFLALGTIAVSGLFLSSCGDSPAEEVMFNSVDQCVKSGMEQAVCQTAYDDAAAAHFANAPRFNGMAACEAEYGAGQCGPAASAANTGGTGIFIPFMAGYMMSNAIRSMSDYYDYRRRDQNYASGGYGYGGAAPIYRNRAGQTLTTVTSTAEGSRATTIAPTRQRMEPANVNTRTVARQGFGGRSSFSFGG